MTGTHPRGETRLEDGLLHGDGVHPGEGDGPDLADPQLVPVVKAQRIHIPVGDEEDALRARACAEVEDLDGELDGDNGVFAQLALVVPAAGADLVILVEVVGGLLAHHHLDDLAGGAVRDLFAAFHLDLERGRRRRAV